MPVAPVSLQPAKVATPAEALSGLEVQDSEPPDGARVTGALEPVTVLPPTSWTVTTGWVVKATPSTAPAGWVVNTSLVAPPTPRLKLDDAADGRPVELAVSE